MRPLSPDLWQRLSGLLEQTSELQPADRAARLELAGADDPELRPYIERLLAAGERLEGFLSSTRGGPVAEVLRELIEKGDASPPAAPPDSPTSAPTATSPPASHPQESIGPYRLLQKVGEGGMGEVWLAEQQEPVRRKVALKLIKAGMDTKDVVARFEAERQALALMDHPAIARVYEAGATPRGCRTSPWSTSNGSPSRPTATGSD